MKNEKTNTKKRASSYTKLKQKYESDISLLYGDLLTLIENKDPVKVAIIKARIKLVNDVQNAIWFGDTTNNY